VDEVLHRIEALPGDGRFAICFRGAAGTEHVTVAQLRAGELDIAPATLPAGWEPGGEAYGLLVDVVNALDRARRPGTAQAQLFDVPGGWDVMIGNVVLERGETVACAAHGPMQNQDGIWMCLECGAKAAFAPG
jgi:hypothetical protein